MRTDLAPDAAEGVAPMISSMTRDMVEVADRVVRSTIPDMGAGMVQTICSMIRDGGAGVALTICLTTRGTVEGEVRMISMMKMAELAVASSRTKSGRLAVTGTGKHLQVSKEP